MRYCHYLDFSDTSMSLFKSRRSSVRMIVDSVSKATSVTVTREYVLTVVVPANPISSKSTTPPPQKKKRKLGKQ